VLKLSELAADAALERVEPVVTVTLATAVWMPSSMRPGGAVASVNFHPDALPGRMEPP